MAGGPYPCRRLGNSFTVTGTLVPDTTGVYNEFGTYLGRQTYKLTTGNWYLWASGVAEGYWNITTVIGTAGTAYWTNPALGILGIYDPGGTATGDATVTVTV